MSKNQKRGGPSFTVQEHPGFGMGGLSSNPDSATAVLLSNDLALLSTTFLAFNTACYQHSPTRRLGACMDFIAKTSQVSDTKERCSINVSLHSFPGEVGIYDDSKHR